MSEAMIQRGNKLIFRGVGTAGMFKSNKTQAEIQAIKGGARLICKDGYKIYVDKHENEILRVKW